MTYEEYQDLTILCNGCGESMRFIGEWPSQYPKPDQPKDMNIQKSVKWSCNVCRIPHSTYAKGVPVMATIIVGAYTKEKQA